MSNSRRKSNPDTTQIILPWLNHARQIIRESNSAEYAKLDLVGFADFMTALLVTEPDYSDWIRRGPSGSACDCFLEAYAVACGVSDYYLPMIPVARDDLVADYALPDTVLNAVVAAWTTWVTDRELPIIRANIPHLSALLGDVVIDPADFGDWLRTLYNYSTEPYIRRDLVMQPWSESHYSSYRPANDRVRHYWVTYCICRNMLPESVAHGLSVELLAECRWLSFALPSALA